MSTSEQPQKVAQSPLPLVLLPGTLCDARIFEPLLDRLPQLDFPVVLTPDARNMSEAAMQVLAKAPASFALLGFSLGGMVAMEIALLAPERVAGLALLSTTPRPVPAAQHAERRALALQARTVAISEFVEQQLWPGYIPDTKVHSCLPLLQNMAESLGAETYCKQTELALSRDDFRPRLPNIRCPTLLVAGDRDLLCPPAAQDELAEGLPHATRVTLAGAGHLALLERTDEIAQAVAAWLETTTQEHVCRNKDLPGPTSNKEHG